jgi:Haspin like kinase domain
MFDPFKLVGLFRQHGTTPEQSYQFETYRKMLKHALTVEKISHKEDPSRSNKKLDKWARFMPRTNVLWLECLLFTLLFRSKKTILVRSDEVMTAVQEGIYDGLKKMLRILDGSYRKVGEDGEDAEKIEELGSAKEVITVAHKEGLLSDEDLEAMKEALSEDA